MGERGACSAQRSGPRQAQYRREDRVGGRNLLPPDREGLRVREEHRQRRNAVGSEDRGLRDRLRRCAQALHRASSRVASRTGLPSRLRSRGDSGRFVPRGQSQEVSRRRSRRRVDGQSLEGPSAPRRRAGSSEEIFCKLCRAQSNPRPR